MTTALTAIFALLLVSTFAENTAKRSVLATTCDLVGKLDLELCIQASEGPFCLTAAEAESDMPNAFICGCKQDADCFTQPVYPWCDENTSGGGTCDQCNVIPKGSLSAFDFNGDHQFCRDRFPSIYLFDPITNYPDRDSEKVAPFISSVGAPAYFREVCNRAASGNSGACEGCHQASPTNTPDIASLFPAYPGTFSAATLRGPRGSIHCQHVYPGAVVTPGNPTGEPRPICAYVNMFNDAGVGPGSTPAATNNLWNNADIPLNLARNAGNKVGPAFETRKTVEWQGACIPCFLSGVGRNGLCALANAKKPICTAASGCSACKSNTECSTGAATCVADGTCTDASALPLKAGMNCMADGHCANCVNDADCAAQDGPSGSTKQPICDLDSASSTYHQCIDLKKCTGNGDCPAGQNCMLNGVCRACVAGGNDCVTNDGPDQTLLGATGKANQAYCAADGRCTECTQNSHCTGTGGANCQLDGTCKNCGTTVIGNANCGAADGGTTGTDKTSQPICDPTSNQCIDACTSNTDCTTRGGSDNNVRGANCQKDGTCKDCTTSPNTCGALDGPPTGDIQGQTTCSATTKQCFNPFSCTSNANCQAETNPIQPDNCQADGSCVNCQVTKTSSTCGALDGPANPTGGEAKGQKNCRVSGGKRECVADCTDGVGNTDCANTQGANCMANGVCFDCESDLDCASNNAWGGDKGGSPVCENKICVAACASNNDCPSTPASNCMKDGRCKDCTSDADCVANDGPPGAGSDISCKANGVCGPPYTCDAEGDNAGCQANTADENCQKDGTCITCATNADCYNKDGGRTPNQPKCLQDGTCGSCTLNADCPPIAPNCGSDGLCYDCRATGATCGAADGGEFAGQENCDPISGQCTNLCTADEDCQDECNPHCNLDTGCCVECTDNDHCPFAHWRSDAADKTQCDSDSNLCYTPAEIDGCATDADCEDSEFPACSPTEGKCVECLFDGHCDSDSEAPACFTPSQTCVECVSDDHCGDSEECGSDLECHDEDDSSASALGVISASLILAFTSLLL